MNWLPTLGAWQFAAAGVVGAAGVILIHLLNRRRHQVLHWGAMMFLQQAVKRKRRSIQLRDAILLVLRTLAVLLFGLALARPQYSDGDALVGPRPLHAILVIDNSLSMSYESLEGSLLAKAKQFAVEVIERLPEGSNVSIIAACGSDTLMPQPPSKHMQEAQSAIERIEIADTPANIDTIVGLALEATRFETNQLNRTVLFTDQQAATWTDSSTSEAIAELGSLQIVDVSPRQRDNTWIAAIKVQDGFVEARTRSTVQVIVQRCGGTSARQAEVSLLVNDQLVATRTVVLQEVESTQSITFEHSFITMAPGGLGYVPIKAVLTPDRLTIDDTRYTIVPVVPHLPIVFVDQYGSSKENVQRGQLGETRALRRLLQGDREEDLRETPHKQSHISLSELDAESLQDARLVVVAGIESPAGKVSLLRDFVEQGGQLLIAAGGNFSASKWQEYAWLDGNGILPAPLTGSTIGETPERTKGELALSLLSFESLRDSEWLRLPGVSNENLGDLYSDPLFFQSVEVDKSPEFSSSYDVLARLESSKGPPLLVKRDIDQGRVVFFSSSLTSNWNTLSKSNAVVMLDRLTRELIRSKISDRDRLTQVEIPVELPVVARNSSVMLQRPGRATATKLEADYIDRERYGVTIRDVYRRGIYELAAYTDENNGSVESAAAIWQEELAVNGDSRESNLMDVESASLAEFAKHGSVSVTSSSEAISLGDRGTLGNSLWWWCAFAVLTLFVAESLMLIASYRWGYKIRDVEAAT